MRRRATAVLVAVILACAGSGAAQPVAEAATAAGGKPIPVPNLDRVEPAVRTQLEEHRAAYEALAAEPDTPPAGVAAAAGRLGQLYFLYGLAEAARGAFDTAVTLAPDDARWRYYLGILSEQEGDEAAAEGAYRAVLERRPEDLPTLLRLGRLALAGNRTQDAAGWFARALAVQPESAAALHGLGEIAFLAGDWAAAAARFEAALERQPEATAIHYQLGLAYRELGDLDRARAELGRRGSTPVAFADPLTDGLAAITAGAGIHILRGTRAFSNGNYALAVEAYRRAVAEDPENPTARQSLASALAFVGDLEAALVEYGKLLAADPGDGLTHYNVGTLLLKQGRLEAAAESLRRAVEAAPELADAYFNLSGVLQRLGRVEESESAAARAVALRPEDREARLQWARLLGRLGRTGEAETEIDRLLAGNPEDPEALLSRGTLLASTGRSDAALATWERVLALDVAAEPRALAAQAIARELDRRGDYAGALARHRQAAELAPDSVEIRLSLAAAQGRTGRLAEAAETYAAVLEDDPASEPAWFGRATAQMLAGADAEARVTLERGVAALPTSAPLAHALARLLAASADPAVRDGARALELAQAVLDRQPSLDHAETLAMALAELGRFEEAAELERRILERARAAGPAERLPTLERRLRDYEQRRAVRAPWID